MFATECKHPANDWSSEIYLSKKIDNNKLILLASELKNESKKRKRNYEYMIVGGMGSLILALIMNYMK